MNTELIRMLLSLSVSGSLVAALLGVSRVLLRGRMNRTWQYYAWLVVFARLLLPFAPQESLMGTLFGGGAPQFAVGGNFPLSFPQAGTKGDAVFLEAAPEAQGEDSSTDNGVSEEAFSEESGVLDMGTLAVSLWAAVAAGMLLFRAASCARLTRRLRRDGTLCTEGEIADACRKACRDRGLKKALPVYINPYAASPMLAGIVQPFLVLPGSQWTREQLDGILAHELTHYTRLDMAYQWAAQLAVCLHWFNPVVHWAARQAARDCELSCDEAVLRGLDKPGRHAYGETLLACVRPGKLHGPLMMGEDAKLLKERLGEIMKFSKNKRGTAVLAALLTVVLCGCSVVSGVYMPSPKMTAENVVAGNIMYGSHPENNTSSTYPADGANGSRKVLYERVPQKSAEPRELILKLDNLPSSTVFEGPSDQTLWLYGSTDLTVSTSQEEQDGKIIDHMEIKLPPSHDLDWQNREPQRYAILRIPQGYYSSVTIHGLESGMSLARLRTMPLTVTASGCALSLPGDSQKPVSALLEDCSGSIGFSGSDVAEINTLKIVSESSSLGLPSQWKTQPGQTEYTRGSGAVPISIHIKECAFSVSLNLSKEETEVYLPSVLGE